MPLAAIQAHWHGSPRKVPNYTAWWTEAHWCEQLAQSHCPTMQRPEVEPATSRSRVQHASHYTTKPPRVVERQTDITWCGCDAVEPLLWRSSAADVRQGHSRGNISTSSAGGSCWLTQTSTDEHWRVDQRCRSQVESLQVGLPMMITLTVICGTKWLFGADDYEPLRNDSLKA